MGNHQLPIAVIGGGPVGLAAAAHLTKNNLPFILFEKGESIGANLLDWGHIRVFSPWKYNMDKAAQALLESHGWEAPDENALPTGAEIVHRYLKPLSELPLVKPSIILNARVISINRRGVDKMKDHGREEEPFEIQAKINGQTEFFEARVILDATGTWNNPNPIGSGGNYAAGEEEYKKFIRYGIPDILGKEKNHYAEKNVLVIGSGHSAINAIIELDQLKDQYPQAEIHWALRKKNVNQVYGGQEEDQLEGRGALGIKIQQLVESERVSVYTPFHITELTEESGKLNVLGIQDGKLNRLPGIDRIISNTGSRPDYSFLRELRYEVDSSVESVPALAELIDPNIHSCGTVRPHGEAELRQKEKDFYVIGSKSYGRAPTFLMATGYEQVRSIVAGLTGDWESAGRVELELPETGVCSTGPAGDACCGTEKNTSKKKSCCG